jgi:heme exporter protein A
MLITRIGAGTAISAVRSQAPEPWERRKRWSGAMKVAFPDRWGWYPGYREISGIVLDTELPFLLRRKRVPAQLSVTGVAMRLIAENLSGERGGHVVFAQIDFSIGEGDALVVTGPNGSGKSTLLRVLAGLLPGAGGTVRIDGGGEAFPGVAQAAHYLGHLNAMKTALTVAENLSFWQAFCGPPRLAIPDALDHVGLDGIGYLPFGYLSTGQRRRVAIARLLINHRPIWLLDEPSSGLDRESETRLGELMQAHRSGGGMIVAATHLPLGLEGAKGLEMEHPVDA